ncbi:MAG: hypothetical protein V5A44_07595 [Haloarculaceae archaeon]
MTTREQSSRGDGPAGALRGQTTLDFAVGMSIFLLTLAFVFTFVPGMLAPFGDTTQAETAAANRIAENLTTGTLGDPDAPYVLDRQCTVEFFNASTGNCDFDGTTTADRVGVVDWQPVNVTIRGDQNDDGVSNILCFDGSDFVERSACTPASGHVVLSGGPDPAGSSGKTVSATRVALLDDRDVTVEVVMW